MPLRTCLAALLLLGLLAQAAAAAEPGRYQPLTDTASGKRFLLTVGTDGAHVTELELEDPTVSCGKARRRFSGTYAVSFPDPEVGAIDSEGKFGFILTYPQGETLDVTGQFRPDGRASGFIRFRARLNGQGQVDPEGGVQCDSGRATWWLPGRRFDGIVGARGGPRFPTIFKFDVLWSSLGHTELSNAWARCDDGRTRYVSGLLAERRRPRLRGGRFVLRGSTRIVAGAGNSASRRKFRFVVRGRVRAKKASGTLRLRWRTESGASCDTGKRRWSLRSSGNGLPG